MNLAVYTLTRDRLAYTQECFASLRSKAGLPFDHFVLDNGSEDGTPDWLREEFAEGRIHFLGLEPKNLGISGGSNRCLEAILSRGTYTHIAKIDNDCFVESANLLGQIAEVFEAIGRFDGQWILSPRVEGISRQPPRASMTQIGGRRVGRVGIVGGLCRVVPVEVYTRYRYPEELPPAWGQDDHFCAWAATHGARLGYVEGLVVHHHETTDGQALRFPAYFERKWKEEKHDGEEAKP